MLLAERLVRTVAETKTDESWATLPFQETYSTTGVTTRSVGGALQMRLAVIRERISTSTAESTLNAALLDKLQPVTVDTIPMLFGVVDNSSPIESGARFGDVLATYGENSWQALAAPYLRALIAEGWINAGLAPHINATLQQMRNLAPSLNAPNIGPSEDGRVVIAWQNAERHFEVEVLPSGDLEFFYKDRASDYLWLLEARFPLASSQSQETVSVLKRFSSDA